MQNAIRGVIVVALGAIGCSGNPGLKPDPVPVSGVVKLPSSTSPNGLTITFQPLTAGHPGGVVLGQDGKFSTKLIPGKYAFYFDEEANAKVASFKQIPAEYHLAKTDRFVTVAPNSELSIEVK